MPSLDSAQRARAVVATSAPNDIVTSNTLAISPLTPEFPRVTFAWAGSLAVGQAHYYRVQGPTFLIEYDNTQNNANHVHSVLRDFRGEFGRTTRDPLREHYATTRH